MDFTGRTTPGAAFEMLAITHSHAARERPLVTWSRRLADSHWDSLVNERGGGVAVCLASHVRFILVEYTSMDRRVIADIAVFTLLSHCASRPYPLGDYVELPYMDIAPVHIHEYVEEC